MCLLQYATKIGTSSLHPKELTRPTTQRLNCFSSVTLLAELVETRGRIVEDDGQPLNLKYQ